MAVSTTHVSRFYSSQTNRVTSAASSSRSTEENMCRPPAGWPSRGAIPPLPLPPAGTKLRDRSQSRDRAASANRNSSGSNCNNACVHVAACPSSAPICPFVEFDRNWKKMEAEFSDMHKYMDSFLERMDRLFVENLKIPAANFCIKKRDEFFSSLDPVTQHDNHGNCRVVYTLDLDGFKPEEIRVTLNTDDGIVSVDASHEDRHPTHWVKRCYSRRFAVTDELRCHLKNRTFKSFLSDKGKLSIEAPLHHQDCCPFLHVDCPRHIKTVYEATKCPACKKEHY